MIDILYISITAENADGDFVGRKEVNDDCPSSVSARRFPDRGEKKRGETPQSESHAALAADVKLFLGSILWPFFGQLALDQVAYREIAAAVDHSGRFAENFTDRSLRSFAFTSLYLNADPADAAAFTEQLKSMHGAVRGVGKGEFAGTRFSAMNPDLWRWVAISGLNLGYRGYLELAGGKLDEAEREVVYQTLRSAFAGLELHSAATKLPATSAEFTAIYNQVASSKLADNGFLRSARQSFGNLPVPELVFPKAIHPLVTPLWRAALPLIERPVFACSDAVAHPKMRELLGVRETFASRVEHAVYITALRLAWRHLPKRFTLDPLAYNRFRYEKIRGTYIGAQLESFGVAS